MLVGEVRENQLRLSILLKVVRNQEVLLGRHEILEERPGAQRWWRRR